MNDRGKMKTTDKAGSGCGFSAALVFTANVFRCGNFWRLFALFVGWICG